MQTVGALEATNTLGTLLDQVERGAEIVITRGGKPVAKLVPADEAGSDDACRRARAAAAGIREMRRGVTLGGHGIKDLIEEGRR